MARRIILTTANFRVVAFNLYDQNVTVEFDSDTEDTLAEKGSVTISLTNEEGYFEVTEEMLRGQAHKLARQLVVNLEELGDAEGDDEGEDDEDAVFLAESTPDVVVKATDEDRVQALKWAAVVLDRYGAVEAAEVIYNVLDGLVPDVIYDEDVTRCREEQEKRRAS